jgi:hypothetical protein
MRAILRLLCATALVVSMEGSAAVPDPTQRSASLPQGWSDDLREAFYFTPQGSHLVPYDWAVALEVADGEELFFAPENFQKLGYLQAPTAASGSNPDDLPIGFVREPAPGSAVGDWLGMNCAACHTGEIVHGDARILVDGAPTLADFQALMKGLEASFDALLSDPSKFERFAAKVDTAEVERGLPLREQVEGYVDTLRHLVASGWTVEPYGFGRLDAFGHILNAVAGQALAEQNYRVPNAPVSYPFLWTTPQQRYVQWNGVAGNPIGRNTGEVLGVFGQMNLRASDPDERFRTTARAENLLDMEQWVASLEAPRWDGDLLGDLDWDKIARGEDLYAAHCQGCHRDQGYEYADPEHPAGQRALQVQMIEAAKVGTDRTMLDNFDRRMVMPGPLAGLFPDEPSDLVPAGKFLLRIVGHVISQDFEDRDVKPEERIVYFGGRLDADGNPLLGWMGNPSYKAGPLAGIWATAPFLHNGSVPTLYDLLSPEAERPETFWVGSTTFDPVKVGFLSRDDDFTDEERARLFHFDTSRRGNANTGHAYPTGVELDYEDKLALIEYLKTLPGPATAPYQ